MEVTRDQGRPLRRSSIDVWTWMINSTKSAKNVEEDVHG